VPLTRLKVPLDMNRLRFLAAVLLVVGSFDELLDLVIFERDIRGVP